MTRAIIFGLMLVSGPAFAKGKAKQEKPKDPPVTILDMSQPDKPESEFPEIAKKGKL